ncbi:MAG TPA: universal stress protein [Rhodanobacteraceae bacterium]
MYATLMVHLVLGAGNTALLDIAGTLAERFHAGVTGIVVARPLATTAVNTPIPADVIEQDIADKRRQIPILEATFRAALQARAGNLQWRSLITDGLPADYLVDEMRDADLFITGINQHRRAWLDPTRPANTADIIMRLGRPVLAVPAGVASLAAGTVVVGWKDAREARRAVADALPFLRLAQRVVVVALADADAEFVDSKQTTQRVCEWLARHDVKAAPHVVNADADPFATLGSIADAQGADLIVAGAYGHSRLREWVLGGTTRNLLRQTGRCVLLSR